MNLLVSMRKAKLTPAELATIAGISRISVYNWLAGRSRPHVLLMERLEQLDRLLQHLLTRNKLPLPDSLDRTERKTKILKLKAVLRDM